MKYLKGGLNIARWGSCDFEQLKRMQKKLEKLQQADLDKFCREVSKEIAARLLRKVIKRTPVGKYPAGTGKVGGTLKRGWTIGEITKSGSDYEIDVTNAVEYAGYVEFGHRNRGHTGWVKGHFMLTISEQELRGKVDKIIERKLMLLLGEVFNGQ